jgi:hypothetical protein
MKRKPHRKKRREQKPLDPLDMLRHATRLQVAAGLRLELDDDLIRTNVRAAILEALEGDEPWRQPVTLDGQQGYVVTPAGLFRLVFRAFGLDRSNPFSQERYFEVVTAEIEATLGRRDDAR